MRTDAAALYLQSDFDVLEDNPRIVRPSWRNVLHGDRPATRADFSDVMNRLSGCLLTPARVDLGSIRATAQRLRNRTGGGPVFGVTANLRGTGALI